VLSVTYRKTPSPNRYLLDMAQLTARDEYAKSEVLAARDEGAPTSPEADRCWQIYRTNKAAQGSRLAIRLSIADEFVPSDAARCRV